MGTQEPSGDNVSIIIVEHRAIKLDKAHMIMDYKVSELPPGIFPSFFDIQSEPPRVIVIPVCP